ncbi:MAG: glycosyltransferase, partial [Gammaproteobacteria bacterium]|nr:glycosyltransferase [Gammaproteobacteria bacterium]
MVKLIYWLSFLGILFAYIGYPMMLVLINKVRKPTSRLDDDRYIPSVSLIIPVHNEEHIIREKLHNIFQLDYPEEKLELIIVSDDSTDKTREIVN